MSWPLASFLLVGVVLVGGWLTYERSRPSARMVAVTATLAAVAALGRDAFAALPEVKPITAITFVVGYALGPLPGFTVGAIGMLASNFALGQGPYTPWQMAAWGGVGVLGAALARLTGRRMGRVSLALACAGSALLAKEIMNVYTWTIGASHTPAALLATAGTGLPFDITDTVASFLFGLAFASELARLLARMRARMDVSWEAVADGAIVVLLVAVCAGGLAGAVTATRASAAGAHARGVTPSHPDARVADAASSTATASAARAAVSHELSFLGGAQNSDGGFGGARGQSSSELYSAWVAMGLAAAGRDPLGVRRDGHSVLDAIRKEVSTLEGPGDLERTILALRACGVSAQSFAGRDLVAELLRDRSSDGSFGHLVNITAFAVFALRAAGRGPRDRAVRAAGAWLAGQQNRDGGFGFSARGGASDVDDTAAALQALFDAGSPDPKVARKAVGFLVAAQNLDGGYPQERGGQSNAQSTAWAIQGLAAAGRKPASVRRAGSRSPLAYLESLLAPDGSVRYSRTSSQTPVWVTAQALTALSLTPFPISPVRPPIAHPAAASGSAATTKPAAALGARHDQAVRVGDSAQSALAAAGQLEGLARMTGTLVGLVLAPMLR